MMKRTLCIFLTAILLATLAGCGTKREHPTETAPVIAPEDTEVVTSDEICALTGTVAALCEGNVLRLTLSGSDAEVYGETVYVRAENADRFFVGEEVYVTFDTVIDSSRSDKDAIIVAKNVSTTLDGKPVIYLYPETATVCSVKLTLNGRLTCTYPAYRDGWTDFTAYPDGTLIFPDGKEYYCLYWEGIQDMDCDFTQGFCVKGEDTAAFLEWALAAQGLTPREANEFIIYWLPRMEGNAYNVIAFQTEAYTEGAVLEITPAPDSLLRVLMAYYPAEEAVEIEPQSFTGFEREGFTVVEWGGCELTEAP